MYEHDDSSADTYLGEPLVALAANLEKIRTYPYYFHQQLPGAAQEIYVRKSVAAKLIRAANMLPPTIHLVILDGWRSYQTQVAIYNNTKQMFQQLGYSPQQIAEEMPKYVALPSKNLHSPSPHFTGGAVDVTLSNQQGWLNMGTAFDEFHEKATSDWYELQPQLTTEEKLIRENRRLLKKIMEGVGFTANDHEWWHFDYGNHHWAQKMKQQTIYSYIEI
ncbi:M15 family metallopeptidase [Bacillus rubiinfantis]|uniref:M15 family metallopeptidase n=1 Tax=Bacillus rubiinfantis TaxID=1499680 RepID=UPI0005A96147|nr:M15 family metallopeptidase [Bacillus rubiinfantis]